VAIVTSKGRVKARKAGKVTITARLKKKQYKCKIIVVKKAVPTQEIADKKEDSNLKDNVSEDKAEQSKAEVTTERNSDVAQNDKPVNSEAVNEKKTEAGSESVTENKTEDGSEAGIAKKPESSTEEKTSEKATESSTEEKTSEKVTETITEERTSEKATETSTEERTSEKATGSGTEEKTSEKATETSTEEKTSEKVTESSTEEKTSETTTQESTPGQSTINADAGEYSINLVHTGEGTYYIPEAGGAANLDDFASGYYTAAMNTYDYMNGMAGAYIEITDKDGDKINVLITDRLPEGKKGDIDLKPDAFEKIEPKVTGRMAITWKIIPLPTDQPIQYLFKPTSTQWWAQVQVRNHRYPIAKLEYLDASTNQYVELPREEYNYFTAANGMGGPGPYTFRVTDIYGHQLIDTGIAINQTSTPISGKENFPY
jgi:expansin (peptidoglycan-binding protein)